MADQVDYAQAQQERLLEAAIRAAAKPIPAGVPGECDECGDDVPRLVGGLCAPCREPHPRVPRRW